MSKEDTSRFVDGLEDIDMSVFGGGMMSSDEMGLGFTKEKNTIDNDDDDNNPDAGNQFGNEDDKAKGGLDLRTKKGLKDEDDDEIDGEDDEGVADDDDDIDPDTGGASGSDDDDDTTGGKSGDEGDEGIEEGESILLDYLMNSSKLKDVFEGLEDDDKPKSIDSLVDQLEEAAEEWSRPEYPNEEMEQLHDFVENGGNLKDYFDLKYGEINLDVIDMEKESNQKQVVTEYMKKLGYKPNRIEKAIERFEDAGILEDQAIEALEELKESREDDAKALLKRQEEAKSAALAQQQKFLTDVKDNIDNINDIRGINISKKEKSKLMEYMFKTDKDGKTQYQKDYNENYHKNMIESAYFTMNKDKIVNKVKSQVGTDVKKEMLDKIRRQGGRRLQGKSKRQEGKSTSITELFDQWK
jgi:hypothetical protein